MIQGEGVINESKACEGFWKFERQMDLVLRVKDRISMCCTL